MSLKRAILVLIAGAALAGEACLVQRLGRPRVRGVVTDMRTKQPLAGARLVVRAYGREHLLAKTKADGAYEISPITYHEFTFPGNEAPPIYMIFFVVKDGYCPKRIVLENRFGGAGSPDYAWGANIALEPAGQSGCRKSPSMARTFAAQSS